MMVAWGIFCLSILTVFLDVFAMVIFTIVDMFYLLSWEIVRPVMMTFFLILATAGFIAFISYFFTTPLE